MSRLNSVKVPLRSNQACCSLLMHRNQDVSSVSSIKSGMRRVKSFDDTKNDTNDGSNAARKSAP
ncbi:hypothetical protein JMJ76_0011836 [Colletotrichum scovillei]|nr:hypothetical protein JMJ76_0011836 [Colletotrichum scovillei]